MTVLRSSKLLAVIFVCTLLCATAKANDLKTTLKRGILSKQLTVVPSFTSFNDYQCLQLTVTNNTAKKMDITVDPGMTFVPDDTAFQHLVTWGDEQLALEPSATSSIVVYAFCGKSYARCPKTSLNFKFWKQGDSAMIKTLKYAKANRFSADLTQKAVWTFTNNHPLNTVYNYSESSSSEQLIKYIATVTKKTPPSQFIEMKHHNRAGQPAVNPNDPRKLFVAVKWQNTSEVRHMYVTVLKENGDVYKRIDGHETIDKDGHTVWVEFNSVNDTKGIYYVELRDNNGKVWEKKTVEVGYNM